jgi:UDP-N-acetylmuramate dehydrogenase
LDKQQAATIFAGIVGSENVMINEPMKNHTSFRVGGPVDLLVIPDRMDNLVRISDFCRHEQLPLFIMGNGTNLVVRDKGIRGVVIKVLDNLSSYKVVDDTIIAETGILISRLSKIAYEHGLSGIEFAEGIPGTLGGAVTMNAGAYNGEIANVVVRSKYLGKDGNITILEKEQHRFGKRESFIQSDGGIVLETELKLKTGEKAEIKALMDNYKKQRSDKQPLELPSAGSVFKRPDGYFAGKLVQDCGLKGSKIGEAEVSCKHCGFIVNAGNASACDIIDLIKYIQSCVMDKFNVGLQTEVKIIGEE